jgi:hypothetical protein
VWDNIETAKCRIRTCILQIATKCLVLSTGQTGPSDHNFVFIIALGNHIYSSYTSKRRSRLRFVVLPQGLPRDKGEDDVSPPPFSFLDLSKNLRLRAASRNVLLLD